MALSLALPLSGLDADQFCALGTRLLYEQGLRVLTGRRPISPSTGSESSGICSLVPSIESTTPEETPVSSRPDTPEEEATEEKEDNQPVHIYYKDRDILNLGANIREPFWQMRVPTTPKCDFKSFMENRSVFYRLGEYGLMEEYPKVSTTLLTDHHPEFRRIRGTAILFLRHSKHRTDVYSDARDIETLLSIN
nr:uncharacterized protein LOC117222570 isoform X1 [Megalopta genalis]